VTQKTRFVLFAGLKTAVLTQANKFKDAGEFSGAFVQVCVQACVQDMGLPKNSAEMRQVGGVLF
jgi:hypothetical protein